MKIKIVTSTLAHAGRHSHYVYRSRDDSAHITFAECEKIELLDTFMQNKFYNLQLTPIILSFRIALDSKTPPPAPATPNTQHPTPNTQHPSVATLFLAPKPARWREGRRRVDIRRIIP